MMMWQGGGGGLAAEELRRMLAVQNERVAALEAALQRERARPTPPQASAAPVDQQVNHGDVADFVVVVSCFFFLFVFVVSYDCFHVDQCFLCADWCCAESFSDGGAGSSARSIGGGTKFGATPSRRRRCCRGDETMKQNGKIPDKMRTTGKAARECCCAFSVEEECGRQARTQRTQSREKEKKKKKEALQS
jgi:hypothetical protein